jgi:pantothenate kinase-related protein Tda10
MTKPKRDRPRNLPGPDRNEVKIWFQGGTGSGKTVLARFIQDALEARGLKVRTYAFGSRDWVPQEAQVVDLTQQNIHDVLTVEFPGFPEWQRLAEEEEETVG